MKHEMVWAAEGPARSCCSATTPGSRASRADRAPEPELRMVGERARGSCTHAAVMVDLRVWSSEDSEHCIRGSNVAAVATHLQTQRGLRNGQKICASKLKGLGVQSPRISVWGAD